MYGKGVARGMEGLGYPPAWNLWLGPGNRVDSVPAGHTAGKAVKDLLGKQTCIECLLCTGATEAHKEALS